MGLGGSFLVGPGFGVGGLIQAAAGLLGGGGLLTKRSAERLIEGELASGVNGIGLAVVPWSGVIRPTEDVENVT
jgi:hypothetical protein